MSGYAMLFVNCILCGRPFAANPERVPSMRLRREGDKLVPDPSAPREPFCRACFDGINAKRISIGIEPFPLMPGAYDAEECL